MLPLIHESSTTLQQWLKISVGKNYTRTFPSFSVSVSLSLVSVSVSQLDATCQLHTKQLDATCLSVYNQMTPVSLYRPDDTRVSLYTARWHPLLFTYSQTINESLYTAR